MGVVFTCSTVPPALSTANAKPRPISPHITAVKDNHMHIDTTNWHYADEIYKRKFVKKNFDALIHLLLQAVHLGQINNTLTLI